MIVRALLAAAVLAGTAVASPLRVISDRPLQGDASSALDVRWANADSVYVTSYRFGVLQVNASSGKTTPAAFAQPGKPCPSCSHLATSDRYLVTSFPVHQMAWKAWNRPRIHHYPFEAVVDLDVKGDRLVILGARMEKGKWSADGAIGWTGSLDKQLQDLRPFLLSRQGAKARNVSRCGFLEPGAVRYFEDGSYVVVPGVEPDVYLYDRTGKLVHTWPTAKLGFVDRCDMTETQVLALAADPEQRAKWRAARTMLDDVLPTPAGPALLLHQYSGGTARWKMVVLRRNGPPQTIELPFTARSDVASLRADVRGKRIAFLVRTFGEWRSGAKPLPARLIVAEMQ